MPVCPLCTSADISAYHSDKRRDYLKCGTCDLVFVPACFHLSADAEKGEYDKHENNADDQGYRRFLSRALTPVLSKVKAGATGLDFGCGPGPTLSVMAQEAGFEMQNYDLYYFDHPELLSRSYDFITMTEVIEHLASPMDVLSLLDGMLRQDGVLCVMTKRVKDLQAFSGWHYKNDPTHICFYSERTFRWLGARMNWELEFIEQDVVLYTRAGFTSNTTSSQTRG